MTDLDPHGPTMRQLLAVVAGQLRRHPEDAWARAYARDVPPLVDELDGARAALVEALGSEGAVPLGGLAAGIRRLAEHAETVTGQIDRVRVVLGMMEAARQGTRELRQAIGDPWPDYDEEDEEDLPPRRWDTGEPLTYGSVGD